MPETLPLINKSHKTADFDCGLSRDYMFNDFLQNRALPITESGYGKVYVAAKPDGRVVGFYLIRPSSVILRRLPKVLQNDIPYKYQDIPCYHIELLARDAEYKHKGVGEMLVRDALKRIKRIAGEIGGYWVTINPKNDRVRNIYQDYGFIYIDNRNPMFYTIKSIP